MLQTNQTESNINFFGEQDKIRDKLSYYEKNPTQYPIYHPNLNSYSSAKIDAQSMFGIQVANANSNSNFSTLEMFNNQMHSDEIQPQYNFSSQNNTIDGQLYYNYNTNSRLNNNQRGIIKNSSVSESKNVYDRSRSRSTGFETNEKSNTVNYHQYSINDQNLNNTMNITPIDQKYCDLKQQHSLYNNNNQMNCYPPSDNELNKSYKSNLSSFRRHQDYSNVHSDLSSKSRSISRGPHTTSNRNNKNNGYKTQLNYHYSTNNHSKGKILPRNVDDEIFQLKKEIERIKRDNEYLREQLKIQTSTSFNKNNIKTTQKKLQFSPEMIDDNNIFKNNLSNQYTPTLNSKCQNFNFSIAETTPYETKCVKMVDKLQEILNTKTVTETYNKVLSKIVNERKMKKTEELYDKLVDLYLTVHGKNSLVKLQSYANNSNNNNKVFVDNTKENNNNIKKDQLELIADKKQSFAFNNTQFPSNNSLNYPKPHNILVTEVKAIWRWIKRIVQRTYFSALENKKIYITENNYIRDRKYQEVVDLITSIQDEYKLKNTNEVKKFIFGLVNKTEKQKNRVDKIRQILETNPIKSKSVTRNTSKAKLS